MKKLPISIGILAWKSGDTLRRTLQTYRENGLFDMVNDTTIFFNEFTFDDYDVIQEYEELCFIPNKENIGIGAAFLELAIGAEEENILLLEHDWNLIESKDTTYNLLQEGLHFLDNGTQAIRYRHRANPGNPHYSFRHRGNELNYWDSEIEAHAPHLLDSLHWCNPALSFPDKIQQVGSWFVTTSQWGNWTNNPCLYNRQFYINTVTPFTGTGVELEGKISKWWNRQNFKVAHGEGLFKHVDTNKYGA